MLDFEHLSIQSADFKPFCHKKAGKPIIDANGDPCQRQKGNIFSCFLAFAQSCLIANLRCKILGERNIEKYYSSLSCEAADCLYFQTACDLIQNILARWPSDIMFSILNSCHHPRLLRDRRPESRIQCFFYRKNFPHKITPGRPKLP